MNSADQLWGNNQGDKSAPRVAQPKKRYRWGLMEVIGSLILLIVTQLIIATIFMVITISDLLGQGMNPSDIDSITAQLTERLTSSGPMIFISSLAMYAAWGLSMWYATKFRGHKSWKRDFWVSIKRHDWWKGALLALGLFAAEYALFFLLSLLNVDTSGSDNSSIFLGLDGIWFYLICFLMVPILGPIFEELFFRGFLLQALIRWFRRGNNQGPKTVVGQWFLDNFAPLYNGFHAFRTWVYHQTYMLSIIITSVLFGFMHFQGGEGFGPWLVVILTGSIGMVFASVTVKTRRLGIAIWGHMFFNGSTIALSLAMGAGGI